MADRYWVGGGANTQFTTAGNWASSSGGAGGIGILSGDNAFFDGVGVNANGTITFGSLVNIQNVVMTSGFTGTINFNNAAWGLNAGGSLFTLGANCTITGTGIIQSNAATTFTSNGKALPNGVIFRTSGVAGTVRTFADNWTVGTFNVTTNAVINGSNINTNVSFSVGTSATCSGTTNFWLKGGSWSSNSTISNNVYIDGNITCTSVSYITGTITWVSGTFTHTGSLNILGSCSLNTPSSDMEWALITISATSTITLLAHMYAWVINISAAYNVNFSGTAGFMTDEFTATGISVTTITFLAGATYTFFHFIDISAARIGSIITVTSSSASIRANIHMYSEYIPGTSAYFILNCNFTRINATGRTLRTWNGTITNCINIVSITDLVTVAATF